MSALIRAAGAVLWREAGDDTEVAVVHRPRYDDWSLPKGKLDPGETIADAAVREIHEETGFRAVLGRHLGQIGYPVLVKDKSVPKTVDYFSAKAVDGEFEPNEEVDELRWLSLAEAEDILTRDGDFDILKAFASVPAALTTMLFVRHAKAGKRSEWLGDDDLRPLADAGFRQAEGVRKLAPLFGVDRVLAAPRLRCVQTVQGVADDLGVDIRHEPLLSEEGYWADPVLGVARLLAIAGDGGTPLVSSQGGVIPDVVRALANRDRVDLAAAKGGAVLSKKGSLWILSFTAPSGNNGPRLVSADYFASPLPTPEPSASHKP